MYSDSSQDTQSRAADIHTHNINNGQGVIAEVSASGGGLRPFEGARLGQIVMQEMSEKVDGYRGVYQGKDFELERK